MTSPIQEIKERLDIVEFIRFYIPLAPAGKNFKAHCPFHKEKTPSFIVSPERQSWHCFGACSEGGDIFKFLMKYENLEFYEALKVLAEKAGVELKKISPAEHKQFGILYDINESAKDFFKQELERSAESLDYLKKRGLKKETIEEFELGFAPENFDALTRHLINLGFEIRDIERAGLNFKTEKGSYLDRFRGRLMFPIFNHFGKVAGFSGRILPRLDNNESGKYINSPETSIFNKSRILYGFHKTKKNILEQKAAILVEGQMDFLMAYQDGLRNAVASSGTALTIEHLKTIKRLADQLIFCFDNDEAGFKAAERSIDLADAIDFNVGVVVLKNYKDPAEAVQKSPGSLFAMIKETMPAMEFYFERYLSIYGSSTSIDWKLNFHKVKNNLRIVLGKIKTLASAVEQAHWIKELSLKTKIEEKALTEEMQQFPRRNYLGRDAELRGNNLPESGLNKHRSALSRRELIAERLISLIIFKEDFRPQLNDYLNYLPENYLLIFKNLTAGVKLEDENLVDLLNLISLRSSLEASIIEEEKMEIEFQELLRQLQLEHLKEKKQELSRLLKEAEESGDESKTAFVLKELSEVSKIIL